MNAYDAEPWADFAVAMAGAAAALAGLLFVAVSINLQVIVSVHIQGRAAAALIMLVSPVFVSACVLVPGQGPVALGVELMVAGLAVGAPLLRLHRPAVRNAQQPVAGWFAIGLIPSVVLFLAPVVAGVGVLTGTVGGLYWLPVGTVVALVGGLSNAWVLLVEVQR